ncbi:aminoacyl-tRNA hydrolase [Lujinxingia litoralis]|uniref:Aminoacyl-tRNA hydrolase n=1 Tax=Lujinxingia litoralis TaxID=2211119 RepID=A0A328C6Y5_9DELT|nr:alternative ribosome rescue aminoacyl-tRNA hydrolase ArfB [Lujinxingia litoralis]RAL23026.1 aminoacyl-tRNA hydrolase [Lujinxingia litoralis]
MSSEDDLEVKPGVTIPGWELYFTATRSGGPGGQHANKASTRVVLHWPVAQTTALTEADRRRVMRRLAGYINEEGVLLLASSETRSQYRNRQDARQRLAEKVEEALRRRKRRIETKPSRAAKRRRVEEKRRRGQKKELRKDPGSRDW